VKALAALLALSGVAVAQPDPKPPTPDPGTPAPSPIEPAGAPAVPEPSSTPGDVTTTPPPQAPSVLPQPASTDTVLHNPNTSDSLAPPEGGSPSAPGMELAGVKLELHGYARMPLTTQGTREPYLVDNDYYLSGFAYTRLYEPDWSELHFSASKGDYKVEFGMFASLYSDYAQADVADQLGSAQASVTAKNFLDVKHLTTQVGVFWDRYGYIEPYDTYVFGRTHQGGAKLAYEFDTGLRLQGGIGFHQADLQQNLGMTPIAHVAAVQPVGKDLDIGAYLLRTWTRDHRQLSPIQDGTMYVAGLDAHYKLPHDRGTSYLAFGYYHMDHALYLAPALEVEHSTGGRGITENFLGLDSSDDGTGTMYTLATDNSIKLDPRTAVRVFGMGTWVRSPQVDEMDPLHNKDRRLYFKWGVEPSYLLLPKMRISMRYDRVILDVYDSQDSFHVLSPKVSFPLDGWGEIFVQYSHYWYGDKIQLRSGQVPLETMPDSNVFKIQAQAVW
jgi:hypothetical protein